MRNNKVKITEFSKLERKVAALWTRVSTEKQERNNCSLENQQRICREYAERNGIIIKKAERPANARILAVCLSVSAFL